MSTDLQARPACLYAGDAQFDAQLKARLHWDAGTDAAIEERVRAIVADVAARGDAAVLEYTARFDGVNAPGMAELELAPGELQAAFNGLPPAQRMALQAAAERIRRYHVW
ncbi:MAG: histidinol dehydrogenase, partial [Burkholderiaceae bacterium]|nr:histidinol dehydrogenase [Burkholderiaceae bacterium]